MEQPALLSTQPYRFTSSSFLFHSCWDMSLSLSLSVSVCLSLSPLYLFSVSSPFLALGLSLSLSFPPSPTPPLYLSLMFSTNWIRQSSTCYGWNVYRSVALDFRFDNWTFQLPPSQAFLQPAILSHCTYREASGPQGPGYPRLCLLFQDRLCWVQGSLSTFFLSQVYLTSPRFKLTIDEVVHTAFLWISFLKQTQCIFCQLLRCWGGRRYSYFHKETFPNLTDSSLFSVHLKNNSNVKCVHLHKPKYIIVQEQV